MIIRYISAEHNSVNTMLCVIWPLSFENPPYHCVNLAKFMGQGGERHLINEKKLNTSLQFYIYNFNQSEYCKL